MTNIAIAFPGGAYGNYLRWILYQLLFNDSEIVAPWDRDGTSHNRSYIKHHTVKKGHLDLSEIDTNKQFELFTIHPVTDKNQDFVENLAVINSAVSKLLILYPDQNTYLHVFHNYLNKVWGSLDHWSTSLKYINLNDLADGWGVIDPHTAPKWVLREFFSYNVFDSFNSHCGWFAPNYTNFGHYVFVSDLLFNFLDTLEKIRLYLGVEWIRDPKELVEFHSKNLRRQANLSQDQYAKKIVESVTGVPIEWSSDSITIYTEAYIQKTLREQGIMLKCTDLNDFPTSTEKLIEVFE